MLLKIVAPSLALAIPAILAAQAHAHGHAPPLAVPKVQWAQPDDNARLLGHLNQHGWYNDVSGFHSPSGVELAIIGTDTGTAFIDATDPRNPAEIYFKSGPSSIWREMDNWGSYLYVVTEGGGGMQIFDLSNPLVPRFVKTYGSGIWSHAHTIEIDRTTGNAYINGTDAGMVILSLNDPENPAYITAYTDDYVHDCWVQDGIAHLAQIYSGKYRTLDVSALPAITILDTERTPGSFTHSIAVTQDNRISVSTDENSTGHLAVWDCSNPGDLRKLSEFTTGTGSIVHNPYRIGNIMHCSWYTDGYVAVDVSDPANPKKLASYDTYSGPNGGFYGAWSCYPYQPTGAIYIGDMQGGLFILEVKCYPATSYGGGLAGSGGFTPRLEANGFASIGNPAFDIDAVELLGGAAGAYVIGFGRGSTPFYGGTLLIDITKPILVHAFIASGSGAGAGDTHLTVPVPNDPSLVDLGVDVQVAQFDPGAFKGVAMSAGLEFKICDPN